MKETMTVHEALCELKTLDKRITKAIDSAEPIFYKEHSVQQIKGRPVSERIEEIKANHQSLMALIARMTAIKAAVNQYNAEKHIVVAGKDYTIAQAIYLMSYGTTYTRGMIEKYRGALMGATQYAERENGERLNVRAENAMNAIYGAKEKADPAAYLKGLMDYKEQHTVELVDPLKLLKVIQDLSEELDAFQSKVDSAIQIANATSVIEIEY